jgi:hypothetical protein
VLPGVPGKELGLVAFMALATEMHGGAWSQSWCEKRRSVTEPYLTFMSAPALQAWQSAEA